MSSGKWEQSNQEQSLEQKNHHEALCLHHMELGNRKTIACTSLAINTRCWQKKLLVDTDWYERPFSTTELHWFSLNSQI